MNRNLSNFEIPQPLRDALNKAYPHCTPLTFSNKINVYASWYEGFVDGFHKYLVKTSADHSVEMERKSLKMAKYICESIASLLLNEKCDIVVKSKDDLDKLFEGVRFWLKANLGIEKSFALGFGALVVGVADYLVGKETGIIKVTEQTKLTLSFVEAPRTIPLTIEDGEVVECAFLTQTTSTVIIVAHVKNENGEYVIHTFEMNKDDRKVSESSFDTLSKLPFFQIIKPNIVDNDIYNNTGFEFISIFANATDILKSIDSKYDAFDLEFVLGKKKMIVSDDASSMVKDVNGNFVKTFDPNNEFFFRVPTGSSTGAESPKPILEVFDPELRHDAFIKSINADLNYLSMKCGLGENFFKFDGSGIATATQVISENSTLYRTIKKHEILLEQALINIARVMMYASDKFTTLKFPKWETEEIKVLFDDSIIEDKGAEMERDKNLVASGLMSKAEFRMRWFGEDEKTAKDNVLKFFLPETIQRYMPIMASGLMTPEMFVELVYPNEANKDELVEFIKSNITKAPIESLDNFYNGDETGDGIDENE